MGSSFDVNFVEPLDTDWSHLEDGSYLRAELMRALSQSGEALEFILDCCTDGVWYWNLDHTEHEWMSGRFWSNLGYRPDEMAHLSAEWQGFIFDEDMAIAEYNFHRHCENPAAPYDQVVRYHHKDGSTRWVRCRGLAIRDNKGRPRRLLGAHTDLTNVMRKQRRLIEDQVQSSADLSIARRVKEDLLSARAENERLRHRIIELQRFDEELNVLFDSHFYESASWMLRIAQRAKMQVGVIAVQLSATEETGKDQVEYRKTVLSTVSRHLGSERPDALLCKLDSDLLVAFDIASDDADLEQAAATIKQTLNSVRWAGVVPEFNVYSITTEASTSEASELISIMLAQLS